MRESMQSTSSPYTKHIQHTKHIQRLKARSHILWATRQFFHDQGFLEVEVPQIVVSPGLEVHLQAFEVYADCLQSQPLRRYLHTSPEYALKRLLSAGMDRIYNLSHCYRDEPPSRTHSPEFTMLEWYMKNHSLSELMKQCEHLIRYVARALLGDESPLILQRTLDQLPPVALHVDLTQSFERLSVRDAFIRYAQIDLNQCSDLNLFKQAAQHLSINRCSDIEDWDTLYFQIFMDYIEPHLGHERPTFLYGFPASQSALARLDPRDPRWALRFELFAAGLELANAFDELTDEEEQRKRFIHDQCQRQTLQKRVYPLDEVLLTHLAQMGQCVGIALGFDRLVMLLINADHINQVRAQSWHEI